MPRHTGPRKHLGPIIFFGVILLTIAFLAHARHRILTARFDEPAQQQTIRDAEPLIAALNAYHAQHAAYPSRLSKLRPDFIPEIPKPTVGSRRWRYWISNDANYNLSIDPPYTNAGPLTLIRMLYHFDTRQMVYSPSTNTWHVDN